ncbi:HigA family addiction module antitoxin [Dokdonella immobilis]|uniref:HigA family addiction module antitoxin n=1 Tax=Dokdonella immobilis TaxID=578942 RepID=UPI001587CFE6|nr:HigA family addiction module antitoxin [Dokdonella immobilis]
MIMVTTLTSFEEERKRPPTHPGLILKADVLPALGVTQEQFANLLGLSRKTVNEILGCKGSVTAQTAVKLGSLLGNSPMFWQNLQVTYDLWQAKRTLGFEEMERLREAHVNFLATGKFYFRG